MNGKTYENDARPVSMIENFVKNSNLIINDIENHLTTSESAMYAFNESYSHQCVDAENDKREIAQYDDLNNKLNNILKRLNSLEYRSREISIMAKEIIG